MHLSMWSTKVGRMERRQVEVTVVNMKQVWSTLVKASTPGRERFFSLWKVELDNEKHLGRRNDRPEFEEHWDKEDSGSPGKEEQLFANKSGINL